jgi:hypothetical protein
MPPEEMLVWVYQEFIGGMQCGGADYTPPDIVKLLYQKGILVYKTRIEHMPVCEACSCPSYAARHYALILKKTWRMRSEQAFTRILKSDHIVDW